MEVSAVEQSRCFLLSISTDKLLYGDVNKREMPMPMFDYLKTLPCAAGLSTIPGKYAPPRALGWLCRHACTGRKDGKAAAYRSSRSVVYWGYISVLLLLSLRCTVNAWSCIGHVYVGDVGTWWLPYKL